MSTIENNDLAFIGEGAWSHSVKISKKGILGAN